MIIIILLLYTTNNDNNNNNNHNDNNDNARAAGARCRVQPPDVRGLYVDLTIISPTVCFKQKNKQMETTNRKS